MGKSLQYLTFSSFVWLRYTGLTVFLWLIMHQKRLTAGFPCTFLESLQRMYPSVIDVLLPGMWSRCLGLEMVSRRTNVSVSSRQKIPTSRSREADVSSRSQLFACRAQDVILLKLV